MAPKRGHMKYFEHSSDVWSEFPDLRACAISAPSIAPAAGVDPVRHQIEIARFHERARERLFQYRNGELPSVESWRSVFSTMGFTSRKHCCAAEQLLRRFRADNGLGKINQLVDLCNAQSLASCIPIAVFDVDEVSGGIRVRPAQGTETYLSFGNESETPKPGEIIFSDEADHAHSRRWTYRQSKKSAVTAETTAVLIVCEAHHSTAGEDLCELMGTLRESLRAHWHAETTGLQLCRETTRFEFP